MALKNVILHRVLGIKVFVDRSSCTHFGAINNLKCLYKLQHFIVLRHCSHRFCIDLSLVLAVQEYILSKRDRQTDSETGRQTDRQTLKQTHTHTQDLTYHSIVLSITFGFLFLFLFGFNDCIPLITKQSCVTSLFLILS